MFGACCISFWITGGFCPSLHKLSEHVSVDLKRHPYSRTEPGDGNNQFLRHGGWTGRWSRNHGRIWTRIGGDSLVGIYVECGQ